MVQHEQGADRNTKDDGPSIYSCESKKLNTATLPILCGRPAPQAGLPILTQAERFKQTTSDRSSGTHQEPNYLRSDPAHATMCYAPSRHFGTRADIDRHHCEEVAAFPHTCLCA